LSSRDADPLDPASTPRKEQFGGYALIEGPIATVGTGTIRGFARLGFADPDAHDIAQFSGAGLVYSGPILGSEKQQEQLGMAVGLIRNSEPFRLDQAAAGSAVDRHEAAIELTYRVQATPWLALQPDVQYIINPGTNPALKNALAVGLRLEVSWEGGF
jgi:porin